MNDNEIPSAINLVVLDPTREAARFDSLTRRIAVEAITARAKEQSGGRSALTSMVAWSRYTIAAAATILIIAGLALVAVPAPAVAAEPDSLVETAGVPAPLIKIATANHPIAAADLVDVFDRMTASTARRGAVGIK